MAEREMREMGATGASEGKGGRSERAEDFWIIVDGWCVCVNGSLVWVVARSRRG